MASWSVVVFTSAVSNYSPLELGAWKMVGSLGDGHTGQAQSIND